MPNTTCAFFLVASNKMLQVSKNFHFMGLNNLENISTLNMHL